MFPNPATSNVNLFVKSRSQSEINYTLVDILGRPVLNGVLKANSNYELNTQDLNNGIYFVTLMQDKAIIENQKLTILK